MELAKNAVLATLTIHTWAASKRDVAASLEVAENHGLTDKRMARVWKSLLPKNDVFDRVVRVTRQVREFHYENTMPWKHKGPRILPTANYLTYTQTIRGYRSELESVVHQLMDAFEGLKVDARRVLNSMYQASDYPHTEDLRQAFAIDLSVDPLPVSDTMQALEISLEEVARIKAAHEREMADTFRRANRDLWDRLFSAIQSFHAQVRDPKKSLRQATFENLRRLLPILERLNVTADEQLEQMRARMETALSEVTLDNLKEDPKCRFETARETDAVFNTMVDVMGPPSVEKEPYRAAA